MADVRVGIRLQTDGTGKARAEIVSLENAVTKLGASSKTATTSLSDMRGGLGDLSGAARMAQTAIAGLAAAVSARAIIEQADAYSMLTARINLSSGTTSEFSSALRDVGAIADRYQQSLNDMGAAYQRLAPAVQKLGMSQADLRDILSAASAGLKISGASAAQSSGFLMQFAQALNSSTVQAEEWNSIQDSNLALVNALEKQLPSLIARYGNLKAAINAQAVTNDMLAKAVRGASAELERQASTMSTTVSGALMVLSNAWQQYIGQADQARGASSALAESIVQLARNLDAVMNPLAKFATIEVTGFLVLKDAVSEVVKNLKEMAGLKDAGALDPEILKLQKMGSGQLSIEQIAGPPRQAADAFFDGIKRGAGEAALATAKLTEAQRAVAAVVLETARAEKIDPAFALAIAEQESGFNQLAKSAAGALGVMQLMPGTARQLGVNIDDLNDNIRGGVLYLKQQQESFKSLNLAAAAYNAGPGNVRKYGGVPPIRETQNYVQSVEALRQKWEQVLGSQGEAFVSAKAQADAMARGFDTVRTQQDAMAKRAEDSARLQIEQIKTRMAALDAERQKTNDLTASQLASAQTYDEKQRVLADASRQVDAYNQRQAAMARQELDAQQAAIEARKQALTAELAQADRYNVTLDQQIQIRRAIQAADVDLAALSEARARAEIAAGATTNDMARQSAQLRQQEAGAISSTIAEYERQVEILNRLTAAKRAGASADQLAMLNSYYSAAGNMPEIVSAEQLARLEQYRLSIAAVKDSIDQLTQSQQKNSEQDVRESQLRQLAVLSANMEYAQEVANGLAKAFDNVGESIGKAVVTMAEYAKQQAAISIQAEEDIKNNPAKRYEIEMAAAEKSGQLQIKTYGDIAEAAQGFFKEGTKGYSAMYNAVKVFRMFEMAMAIKSMVTTITGNQMIQASDSGRTISEVSQSAVRGQAKASEAVANQASGGDPYSAFPRAAAMAALMAAIGFAVMGVSVNASDSNSGVGGSGYVDQSGVNGGVFGDAEAQGDILSALEIIRDNSSNDLNYSAEMLKALRNIESGLSGVSNALIRTIYPSAVAGLGSKSFDAQVNPLNSISDPLTKALHSIIMSTTTKISGYGIQSWAQSLDQIIAKGLGAASFTEIEKTTKIIGITVGKSVKNIYDWSGANEAAQQFTKIIKGIADTIKAGGEAFGMAGEQVMKKIGKVQIDLGRIDLKGLSGQEIQEKLSAEFDRIASQLAQKAMPKLGPFQQIGESYFKTYVRVAEGINRATGELERMGIEAINFRDIANKQGDVAAEIVRQSLMAQNGLADGVRQYIDALDGSATDVIDAYKKLIAASNMLKTAGIGDTNLDRTMINAAGGLDAFNDAMQAFNDNFLTDAQRYAGDMRVLSEEFANLGYTLPDNKDAFRDIVLGIDTSTEAGRKLFGRMIALSDAFAKAADEADKLREKYADKLDPLANIRRNIEQVGIDFNKLLLNAIEPIQSRGDKRIADLMRGTAVDDLNDLLKNKKAREDEIARLEKQIADETAKKKPNNKLLVQLRKDLDYAKDQLMTTIASIDAINSAIADIDAQIRAIQGETAEEIARAKAPLLDAAAQVMTETLADIFQSLEQSIRQSQQRLQSVLDFQRNLETQIAQMRGSSAVAALANSRYAQASGAVRDYKAGLTNQSVRDVDLEMKLLGDLQTAIMDRYNAEQALLQEQVQAQADALNQQLQQEIEAINASTAARVQAINDALEADIKARQKADEALIKAQQKADEALIKAQQKADEALIKARQKADEALIKAQQKAYDKEIKALQKKHDLELAGLQKELDAANKLKDAIKNIADYAKSMVLGQQSTISPEARLAESRRQYEDLRTRAGGGDSEAMSQLTNASDAYLEAAKQYYGSSTQYQNIFDGVRRAMEQIGGMSAPDPNSIQARIDVLREAQADEMEALRDLQAEKLDAIREAQQDSIDALREGKQEQLDLMRENQQDQIAAIRESQQGSIDAMRESAQQQIEAIQKAAQSQIDAAQKSTQQAIADLSDPNKNAAMRALRDATVAELQEVARLAELTRQEAARQAEEAKRQAQEQAQEAIRMAQDQLRLLDENARLSAAQLSALNAMLANIGLTPISPQQVPAYAGGGYAQAGLALVGEQGPELVRFERPAQVMTAAETRQALAGDAETKAFLAAIKAELRALVVTQSSANPQVIEKLTQLEQRMSQIERQQRIKA